MPCAAAAPAASGDAPAAAATSTSYGAYLRSMALTASKIAACTMAIIRICTGTGALAISVARTAVWFQSVTTSARAANAVPTAIEAPRNNAVTDLAALVSMPSSMKSGREIVRVVVEAQGRSAPKRAPDARRGADAGGGLEGRPRADGDGEGYDGDLEERHGH